MTVILDPTVLAHHGVKGMHWGVRKDDGSSSRFTPHQKEVAKKVAIGTAIVVAVAGAAYFGHKLNTDHQKKISDISKSALTETGKKAAEKIVHEQTDIIYSARGQHRGFTFIRDGGNVQTALKNWEDAFGVGGEDVDVRKDYFHKMDDGRIATSFMDGSKDRAGRLIPHQFVIPKSMAKDLNSVDDVKTVIWPQVKDQFAELYKSPPKHT